MKLNQLEMDERRRNEEINGRMNRLGEKPVEKCGGQGSWSLCGLEPLEHLSVVCCIIMFCIVCYGSSCLLFFVVYCLFTCFLYSRVLYI